MKNFQAVARPEAAARIPIVNMLCELTLHPANELLLMSSAIERVCVLKVFNESMKY